MPGASRPSPVFRGLMTYVAIFVISWLITLLAFYGLVCASVTLWRMFF